MKKRVFFSALPGVSVSLQVGDNRAWVKASTENITVTDLYIEVESDGDEVTAEDVLLALRELFIQVEEVVLREVNRLVDKIQNPPSSL